MLLPTAQERRGRAKRWAEERSTRGAPHPVGLMAIMYSIRHILSLHSDDLEICSNETRADAPQIASQRILETPQFRGWRRILEVE